jgi:hypothetical protein
MLGYLLAQWEQLESRGYGQLGCAKNLSQRSGPFDFCQASLRCMRPDWTTEYTDRSQERFS